MVIFLFSILLIRKESLQHQKLKVVNIAQKLNDYEKKY